MIAFITHFKICRFIEIWISQVASKLYRIVPVGFWNLCIKYSAFVIIQRMLRVIAHVLLPVSSQLKSFETFSLILNHDESPVFLENLLF